MVEPSCSWDINVRGFLGVTLIHEFNPNKLVNNDMNCLKCVMHQAKYP